MGYEHQIRLFREGTTQVVHIPPELELPGTEAVVRKVGDHLVIEALKPKQSLVEWLQSQPPLDESIGEIEDWPPEDDIRL